MKPSKVKRLELLGGLIGQEDTRSGRDKRPK